VFDNGGELWRVFQSGGGWDKNSKHTCIYKGTISNLCKNWKTFLCKFFVALTCVKNDKLFTGLNIVKNRRTFIYYVEFFIVIF